MAILDEPSQFALGKTRAHQVKLGEVVDDDWAESQCLLNPFVEGVAIAVFNGSQCMRHTLMRVNNGTGEVIGGVGLESITGSVMRDVLSAVKDWVTQALDLVLHVQLCTNAVVFVRSCDHALKNL